MCLMAPARVVAVDGTLCEVEIGGRVDKASMMLEPDLVVGDWVLVNSGTVVRRLDEEQAAEISHAFGVIMGLDEGNEPSDDPVSHGTPD
jgi:hydrogenase assembly chaperone HypC/HupF